MKNQQPVPARAFQMIADASRSLAPDRPVEISLSPEELGKVRLTLHGHDNGVSVAIAVERPETLDLMRRHMDVLVQNLKAAGYADVRFDFAGSGQGRSEKRSQQGHSGRGTATHAVEEITKQSGPIRLTLPGDRVDMRL